MKAGVNTTGSRAMCYFPVMVLLMAFLLTACEGVNSVKPSEKTLPERQPATLEQRVDSLLRQAERSLSAGRLTTPENDNALDRFRAVLLLQPNNARAIAGIDDIVLRYAGLTRSAIAAGRWSSAETFIARANSVKPGNLLIDELQRQIVEAKRLQQAAPSDDEVLLSAQDLTDSKAPSKAIQGVAERVLRTQEALLIVARTDREGRWLYQQIKKSAGGYRVRGDIRLGEVPKIVFLPPL